jgi:hypothetical protein
MDTIDIFLYVSYLLIAIGAIVSIVMPLMKSLDNPASLAKTGIGIALILVIFFVAYSISDDAVVPKFTETISSTVSKFVGGTLITVYILFLLAIGGIVVTEINKATK